jgi:hypothetical protein
MKILSETECRDLGVQSAIRKRLRGKYTICPHCGEAFQTGRELLAHQDDMGHVLPLNNQDELICDTCGKVLKMRDDNTYFCKSCGFELF